MTLAPLDFTFPLMSDLSTRPPHAVALEEMLPELDEELASRRTFYARMVDRQKMTREAADRHIAILADIRADFISDAKSARQLPSQTFTWDVKVRELRRELAIRRSAWPKRIASPADPLDAAAAARRMERLEAVHFHYWIRLFVADDLFADVADREERRARVRAEYWRRYNWERQALAAGDPAARPAMKPFFDAIDSGVDAAGLNLWNDGLEAARRFGFAPAEQIAA